MASNAPVVEEWEPTDPNLPTLGKLLLRKRPGSASGYRGVHKVNKKTFQARRAVGGKTRHVFTSSSPKMCAYVLAAIDNGLLTVDNCRVPSKSTAVSPTTTMVTVDALDVQKECDKLLAAGRYTDWYKLRSGLGLETRLPLSPRKNV